MPGKRHELRIGIIADEPKRKPKRPISADCPQSFCTRVAGVTFNGRQRIIERCAEQEPLLLVRDPKNKYDKGAVKVMRLNGEQLGFVHRSASRYGDPTGLASQINSGNRYPCRIVRIDGYTRQGVLIEITNNGPNKLTEGESYDALVQRRLTEIKNNAPVIRTPVTSRTIHLTPLSWSIIIVVIGCILYAFK